MRFPVAIAMWSIAVLGASAIASAQPAPPAPPAPTEQRVTGKVTAVTASELYVDFGADAGVRPGDVLYLSIGDAEIELEIVDVAPTSARAILPPGVLPPHIGDRASALARPPAAPEQPAAEPAQPPDPPAVVAARWRGVDLGRPRLIGFEGGPGAAAGQAAPPPAVTGRVAVDYLGTYDLRDPAGAYYHRVQVRSDLDVAPPGMGWLDYSHRLRLRLDFDPGHPMRFPGARDALLVYRLRAGLTQRGLRAEIGRTDAAPIPGASLIDGATLRYRIAPGVYVGGFGGASPQLLDLAPALDGYRFGAYASYRYAAGQGFDRWRLSADLGLVGTTFDGSIDRRALGLRAAASSRQAWISAQGLVDFYPAGHPADRPSADLSTAAVDAGMRWGGRLRLSAGFDRYRPERTREALALLPADYLATAGYSSARSNLSLELIRGLDLDLRAGYRWRVTATVPETEQRVGYQIVTGDTVWFGGGLRKYALLLRDDRISVGGDGYFGGYQDGGSGYFGYALPVHPRVDVDLGYRLTGYRYGDENQRLWRHTVRLGVDAWAGSRVTLQLELDAHFGDEQRVFTSFASAGFHF